MIFGQQWTESYVDSWKYCLDYDKSKDVAIARVQHYQSSDFFHTNGNWGIAPTTNSFFTLTPPSYRHRNSYSTQHTT